MGKGKSNSQTQTPISPILDVARPTAPTVLSRQCVIASKLMSPLTMGLKPCNPSVPPPEVYLVGDDFNVDGIDAMASPTQMIGNQFVGNERNEQLVHQSVGELGTNANDSRNAIAVLIPCTSPLPARDAFVGILGRYVNLGKEAAKNPSVKGDCSLPSVMGKLLLSVWLKLRRGLTSTEIRVADTAFAPRMQSVPMLLRTVKLSRVLFNTTMKTNFSYNNGSHAAKDHSFCGMARLGLVRQTPFRAVSILAQNAGGTH